MWNKGLAANIQLINQVSFIIFVFEHYNITLKLLIVVLYTVIICSRYFSLRVPLPWISEVVSDDVPLRHSVVIIF